MAQVYDWPQDLLPSTFNIRLKTNKKQFTSPFNNSTQEARFPGSMWKIAMTFESKDDDESRDLETVIYQLESGGRLRIPDFGRSGVNQTGITVMGSNQVGGNLITQGWPPNKSKVLLKGEYIEVGDELKYVLADVNSDSAGRATIPVSPWLRSSYASGQAVNVKTPCGYFKLADDENGVDRRPGMVNAVSLNLVEAFY